MNLLDIRISMDIHQYRIYIGWTCFINNTIPKRVKKLCIFHQTKTHLLHLLAEVDTAHRTIAHKQYLGFSMVQGKRPVYNGVAGAKQTASQIDSFQWIAMVNS